MTLEEMQREMDNLRFANLYMHDMYKQMEDAKKHAEGRWLEAIEFLEVLLGDYSLSEFHKEVITVKLRQLKELPA